VRSLVDTNILLHAVNAVSPVHAEARAALAGRATGGPSLLLTWPIVYEFLRVATHPRVFPTPLTYDQAWTFVGPLLSAPACGILVETPAHLETLTECARRVPRLAGNLLHDFHTAVLMLEHGVADILTLDTDFRAFPWVRIRGFSDLV
jgi:toxin-antitoxin system PIN domain toxin